MPQHTGSLQQRSRRCEFSPEILFLVEKAPFCMSTNDTRWKFYYFLTKRTEERKRDNMLVSVYKQKTAVSALQWQGKHITRLARNCSFLLLGPDFVTDAGQLSSAAWATGSVLVVSALRVVELAAGSHAHPHSTSYITRIYLFNVSHTKRTTF